MIWGPNQGRSRSGLPRLVLAGASVLALMSAGQAVAAEADAPISTAVAAGAATAAGAAYTVAEIQDPPAPAAAPATASPAPDFGKGFFERFVAYQAWEMGKMGPPDDPNAPPSRRAGWPTTPQTTPPMPFTEWPYGAATAIGVNRPNSVDSPLMVALAPSGLGKLLSDAHVQAYGWVDVGGNLSTSKASGGNAPGAYDYMPNTVQLDQAVLYVERTPDTVQTDHIDWGFRLSGIYGTDYRYTTAYGLWSYQLLKQNAKTGYDAPMVYGEVYIPNVAQGLLIRFGRYIAVPDIEAQLAPNNYMYSHSLGYTFDNYTNTGVLATLAVTKNLFVQAGVNAGTESLPWHIGQKVANPFPNPLYPRTTFLKDPGATPSFTGCLRYQTDSGDNDVYLCANGINGGDWGYNNLQWCGMIYYHKFNDKWHVSFETYNEHQNNVLNLNNPQAATIMANDGTPFSGPATKFNAPGGAFCSNKTALDCTASAQLFLVYLNYHFHPRDNLSFRAEYYDDMQGQRTGTKTRYVEFGLGWQHWLSPQIELRPEITHYMSLDANAFNGNSNLGIAPDKNNETVLSGDAIVHF